MQATAQSFDPIEGAQAHTLILGTMPGQASLDAHRYYAHPRNAFWPILLAMIKGGAPCWQSVQAIDYDSRCAAITAAGYAVWDVLASCERPGSLDSRIVRSSEQPNDIVAFGARHPELRCIAFNGRMAEKLFARHIKPIFPAALQTGPEADHSIRSETGIRLIGLPSTSPAMASLTLSQKHQRWAEGLLG